jgi:Zn-finger nucleic acid-binding protein
VLGPEAAVALLAGVEFHYTPKHASWLNRAELEIGIMEKQCTGRRMSAQPFVAEEVTAWEHRRNVEGRGINWTFTREKADEKLGRHYVT